MCDSRLHEKSKGLHRDRQKSRHSSIVVLAGKKMKETKQQRKKGLEEKPVHLAFLRAMSMSGTYNSQESFFFFNFSHQHTDTSHRSPAADNCR